MGLEYSDKTSCFEPKLFFSKVYKEITRSAMNPKKNTVKAET